MPTLNFRYGKTYSKAADDSISEFSIKQRKLQKNETHRIKTTPRLTPIRNNDEVARMLKNYEQTHKFKGKQTICKKKFLQKITFRTSNHTGGSPNFWLHRPHTTCQIQ